MIENYGKHRIRHGNVMESLDELMQGEKADVFYSDPPWGQGNLKYWQTINTKMNDVPSIDIELEDFLNRIFQVATQYAKGIVFIEYGKRWHDQIKQKGESFGLVWNGSVEVQYKGGKSHINNGLLPLDLHFFSRTPISLEKSYLDSVHHTHGYKTLQMAVAPFVKEGGIVMDPCCGMGYSAQIAIDSKMSFRGNEINKKRLDKTIARLKQDV